MPDRNPVNQLTRNMVEFYEKLSSWEHNAVKRSDLSLPQMHTIEIIGQNPKIRMKDLASRMGLTMGTLTVMVDRLEKSGLAERRPNPDDRRSYMVDLTPAGFHYYHTHHRQHLELTTRILETLSPAEARSLNTIIEKLISKI